MPYEEEDPPFVEPDVELNALATAVIGAAIEVHRRFGPGLDEALYQASLWAELRYRNIEFAQQVFFDVRYRDEVIGTRRIDLIVGNRLVVELKAVEQLSPLHMAQVKTYLKITGLTLGLLINFNVILLKDGLRRIIYHH
ncbi:MAG TPA: GxxExxY protein [Tepidisphaeraceae bacterium]|nr:GxxExxY protein [Tepidisphaeraceae bacterium]